MYRVQKWKALVVDLIHQISAGEFGVPMGGPYDPHLQRAQDVPAYHGPVTRERNPSRGIYTTDCTNVRTENTRIQGYDQGIVDERGFNIHHSGDRIFAPGEIAAVRTALANARREIQDAPLLAFQKHRALAEIEKAEKEPTPSRLSRVSQTLSGLFKATGKLAENAPAISAIVSQISRFLGN
jgi:hypothetical protein